MIVSIDEQNHAYFVNGDIADTSVTELLHRHGLAPNYDGVDEGVLSRAIGRGTAIHKEVEKFIKTGGIDFVPTTQEALAITKYISDNFDGAVAEFACGWERNGYRIGGTADLLATTIDGKLVVADYKTTATFQREYVSWQVSLYDYFLRQLGNEGINGHCLSWKGADKFICFHCPKDAPLKVYELDKVDDSEIEKLLQAEFRGEKYQRPYLSVTDELAVKFEQAEQRLAEIERQKVSAELLAKELRQKLCDLFEQQGIKSWETPNAKIKVTYVAPTTSLAVDSKKLQRQYPHIYGECAKPTAKKAYVRIKIKEDENED